MRYRMKKNAFISNGLFLCLSSIKKKHNKELEKSKCVSKKTIYMSSLHVFEEKMKKIPRKFTQTTSTPKTLCKTS